MLQINKPSEVISAILGEQNYNHMQEYRFINYCINSDTEQGILLYNNLTKELILISENEYNNLKNSNFTQPKELIKNLIKKWFLVPQNYNEMLLADQLLATVRTINKENTICNFTILPTTACNARCFYCYEAGTKVKSMNQQIAFDVAKYIIKQSKGKTVRLNWFGGEPLCNIQAIDIICETLKDNNINFYSTMVSNAYLFNDELITKATSLWKLKWIQITLDGLQETYNNIKNYIHSDPNPFQRVINNIEYLLNKNVAVQIRINMDSHNADELIELTDFLNNKFSVFKKLTIYAQPIYEGVGYKKTSRTDEERKAITQKYVALCKYLDKTSIKHRSMMFNKFKCYACQADNKTWVMILPDGKLGYCEHFVEDETFGTIYDNSTKRSDWSKYCKPYEKCKKCAYYPTCIILEKCPIAKHKCFEYEQINRLEDIRRGMMGSYKEYMNKKGNE